MASIERSEAEKTVTVGCGSADNTVASNSSNQPPKLKGILKSPTPEGSFEAPSSYNRRSRKSVSVSISSEKNPYSGGKKPLAIDIESKTHVRLYLLGYLVGILALELLFIYTFDGYSLGGRIIIPVAALVGLLALPVVCFGIALVGLKDRNRALLLPIIAYTLLKILYYAFDLVISLLLSVKDRDEPKSNGAWEILTAATRAVCLALIDVFYGYTVFKLWLYYRKLDQRMRMKVVYEPREGAENVSTCPSLVACVDFSRFSGRS